MIKPATKQLAALALAVLLQACQTAATKSVASGLSPVKAPSIEVTLGERGIVDKEIMEECKTNAILHQKFSKMIKGRKDIDYDISIQIEKLRKLGFGVLGTKFGGNEVVLSIIQQKNTAISQTFETVQNFV
ncbi:hypothetical protein [Permianibacter aggregans]|nr:hypothetical protein [Permianibacter aggregans]QGX39880.1 hypothetical protein E2H98_09505 [Permianibacter aggregans]